MDVDAPQQEVRVRFTTQLPNYGVTNQPIALPASLRRSQLSQTINHLLQLQPTVPFDFLINGEFLRTSLYTYITAQGISMEEIIVLE